MATPGGMTPASLRAPPSPPRLRQAAQQSSGASDISCSYTFDGSESATVSGRGGAGPPTGAVIYPASDAPARMRLLINANLLKDTASRQRHLGSSAQQRKATNTYAKVALLLLLVTLAAGAPSGGMSAKPASRVHGHNPASKTPPSEGSGQVSAGPSHTSYHTASTGRLRGADAVAAARYTDNHEAAKISQSLRHAARADAAHHARRQLLGTVELRVWGVAASLGVALGVARRSACARAGMLLAQEARGRLSARSPGRIGRSGT
eukprot:363925-Chlamydomonas_euryale.AAC.24